jgi:hypothetical protein
MREGRLVNFYTGKDLPKLREGAMVDLHVLESDFQDPTQCKALAIERKELLFKAGTRLFLELNPSRMRPVGRARLDQEHVNPWHGPPSLGAFVNLEEDLYLRLSGSKKGSLSAVKCSVPVLGDADVKSLNHAYTSLSKEFEVDRTSFGGNVFEVAHVFHAGKWMRLEQVRDLVMAGHERAIMTELGIEDVEGRINEILKR